MKFILKTEANRQIGFGHLRRLEVVAQELIARSHEVVFVEFNLLCKNERTEIK